MIWAIGIFSFKVTSGFILVTDLVFPVSIILQDIKLFIDLGVSLLALITLIIRFKNAKEKKS